MNVYLTEPLSPVYSKSEFDCGNEILTRYLQKQAKQDIQRKLSACFILTDGEQYIKGYHTLSNAGIPREIVPGEITRKLPSAYVSLPVTLLGRLAVSTKYQGQGIGKLLLIDALRRSYDVSHSIGSMAIIVDPIDPRAEEFYKRFNFIKLPHSGKMFLAMKTLEKLFT